MNIINESNRLFTIIGKNIDDYVNKYKITDIYKYDLSSINFNIFEKDKVNEIKKSNNEYEQNRKLKYILNNILNENIDNKLDYYNWIVKDWGGIGSFRKKIEDIDSFLKNVKDKKIKSIQFSTISSFSKIISFIQPNDYFIYDSRVAYVLNWLLLKNYSKDNYFFIIPSGRNSDLVKYSMDTIISLFDKKNDKQFYPKRHSYFIYCDFIKVLYNKIKNPIINDPFYFEMLLFGLFEKICDEIKKDVEIIIS